MLSPDDYAKSGTESAQQVALFMWASLPEQQERYPELRLMFHIPNGRKRSKIDGARLKAEGAKPGVPDIFLPVARRGFYGLFIEMKAANGALSTVQHDYLRKLTQQNYCCSVVSSFAEAKNYIEWYLRK